MIEGAHVYNQLQIMYTMKESPAPPRPALPISDLPGSFTFESVPIEVL